MMNREERRRKKIKGREPVVNVKFDDVLAIKKNAEKKATDRAFFLMLAIPTMVIHDKFGQLMKREGREQTFTDLCIDLYEALRDGYVTLDELKQVLKDEAGIEVVE